MVSPFSHGRGSVGRMSGLAGRSLAPLLMALMMGLVLARPAFDLASRFLDQNSASAIELVDPGKCRSARPQLVIPVLDISDSVIGPGGADPEGRSFDETRLLARHLAEYPCTARDRFGSVIFAQSAVELEPIPLRSLSVIEAALQRPPAAEVGSGTRLDLALKAAAAMAARFPTHDATVIVLSDVVVDDPVAVGAELSKLDPTRLHLVALGEHDSNLDARFATVSDLGRASSGEVARALNRVVIDARGKSRVRRQEWIGP